MAKKFNQPKVEIAPELQFMSKETIEAVEGRAEQPKAPAAPKGNIEPAPEGYKINPLYVEKKTKRVQLVLQPSLYEKVKAAADAAGSSFNDYCHRLLEEATREE